MRDPLAAVPGIAPQLSLVRLAERVFLIGEHVRVAFDQPVYVRLLTAADATRSLGSLIDALCSEFSDHEILFAAEDLLARGHLVDVEATDQDSQALVRWLDLSPSHASGSFSQLSVLRVGKTEIAELEAALSDVGLCRSADAALCLLVTDDYLDAGFRAAASELWDAGRAVIPFKPCGRTLWLGPLLDPARRGPCWRCLEHGVRGNRPVERYLERSDPRLGFPLPPAVSLAWTRRIAASFAALQLAELSHDPSRAVELREHVLTLELPRFSAARHRLVPRSGCELCAPLPVGTAPAMTVPPMLQRALRLRGGAGGHRVCSAEETFARCAHLVSPITGPVASLGPSRDRDHPLRPVYGAAYFVCPAPGGSLDAGAFSRPSLGKGRTSAQARASALAEAIERRAAIWTGDEPCVRASARELGGAARCPPALLDFSARQYAERASSDPDDWRHRAPLPFSPEQTLSWMPCWSLGAQQLRYVPASYVFNHAPTPPEERVCPFNPNGTAAGNCLEEAILQALLELVERDAVAIWWYNRLSLPGIDLSSFDDDHPLRVQAHYAELGWKLWALDLTHDLGIATVAALALHEGSGRFAVGFGSHLDPALALERALTEVHQVFDPMHAHPPLFTLRELTDPTFVMPNRGCPAKRCDQMPRRLADDLRDEVIDCEARLNAAGLEALVLDYTRPELVLNTVRVIVPGLRHFWRRLGPGRLYDVPVALGLRARPLHESELNPITLRL